MIFIDSIFDLEYYKNANLPCYCEHLVYASDMQAQAPLYNGNGTYSINIYVYSADGLTQYEDATSYFNYFFGQINGQHYFAIQLKTFSPAMCIHACYILRVVVYNGINVFFDKYTERYCQTSCCDVARDIEISQDDITGTLTGSLDPGNNPTPPDVPTTECGAKLIRITASFTCIDQFGDYFFGEPSHLSSGTYFDFQLVSNIQGRIVARPREIKRDVSYNCQLQRSYSARQYLLEGFEYFPAWKMVEIENMLHANSINVSDFITGKDYQWDGGTAFNKVEGARDCDEVFKLETTLRDCYIRQIFGCSTNCVTDAAQTFIVPGAAEGYYFYDENFNIIGDYTDLLSYYRGITNVTSVADVEIDVSASCGLYAVFTVDGTGYIPTSFYYAFPTQAYRVFGQSDVDISQYCQTLGVQCAIPQIGTITYSDMACDAPVIGTITYSDAVPVDCGITDYGYWYNDTSSSQNYLGQVSFNIDASRAYPEWDGSADDVYIAGEIIGIMGGACRPINSQVIIDNTVVATLPADWSFIIDVTGIIYFYGSIMPDAFTLSIVADNLYYNQ